MKNVTGNTNFVVLANIIEVTTVAVAKYVRRNGLDSMQGAHVNQQLIADTVAQRVVSNIQLNAIASSVK